MWSTDGQPWIAANVYLREMAPIKNWSEATIARKAADLRHLAQWLSTEGRTFWDPEVRLGGKLMVAFRDSLFGKRATGNRNRGQALQASTIRQIMREAFDLCSYWKAGAESIRGSRTLLVKSRWKRKALPPAFSIRVIPTRRGEQSLTLVEVKSVWTYLYEDCRPPRRWGRGLSKREWQLRMAFWARDCMIWALLISTGLRRGEVPGVMLHDVKAYDGAGWWVHLVDPREHLGGSPKRASVASYGAKFKTGSRDVMVWFQDWFHAAFSNWLAWRSLLVGMSGAPDHEMLLVSKRGNGTKVGSPLTYDGLRRFFDQINTAVGPFSGDAGTPPFFITAHVVRHTLESILQASGVPIFFRQATFGHRRPETTANYGTVYRTDMIRAQEAFRAHLNDGLERE